MEESGAASLNYPCCTFRGSLMALDADTGRQIWKTYTISEAPKPTRKNSRGVQQWAPAGAAIWGAPTIDVERRAIYVTTGNAYTAPAAVTADAVTPRWISHEPLVFPPRPAGSSYGEDPHIAIKNKAMTILLNSSGTYITLLRGVISPDRIRPR